MQWTQICEKYIKYVAVNKLNHLIAEEIYSPSNDVIKTSDLYFILA